MERVVDEDMKIDFNAMGSSQITLTALNDVNKMEAEKERARALRRQQRNGVLMQPYLEVCSRMKGLQFSKSDIKFGEVADVLGVGALFLDRMSELMIRSPAMLVPHEDVVGDLMSAVTTMTGQSLDQAKYLIEKFIDLLSNRENGSKAFEVRQWSFEKKVWFEERLRYLIYEEVGGEAGWRLSEDGMRLTLRVFNTDLETGNINHDLLERAFARKNIDEILYNLNQHKQASRRQSALIQAAVRDIKMMTYLSWEHVGDPMIVGRSMAKKQRESTQTFKDNISGLLEDDTLIPSQRDQLTQAMRTLNDIDRSTSSLYMTMLDAEGEVREILASSIRVMTGQTMMPDFFAEVLAPMLRLGGEVADNYCVLVNNVFTAPLPVSSIFDLGHVLVEAMTLQDLIAEEAEYEEVEEDEVFVALETLDIGSRKRVKDFFVQIIASKPILSDYIREVLSNKNLDDSLRLPAVFQALSPPEGYKSMPIGKKYEIENFMSGDDLKIWKV